MDENRIDTACLREFWKNCDGYTAWAQIPSLLDEIDRLRDVLTRMQYSQSEKYIDGLLAELRYLRSAERQRADERDAFERCYQAVEAERNTIAGLYNERGEYIERLQKTLSDKDNDLRGLMDNYHELHDELESTQAMNNYNGGRADDAMLTLKTLKEKACICTHNSGGCPHRLPLPLPLAGGDGS